MKPAVSPINRGGLLGDASKKVVGVQSPAPSHAPLHGFCFISCFPHNQTPPNGLKDIAVLVDVLICRGESISNDTDQAPCQFLPLFLVYLHPRS